ncbi:MULTISPECIES: hypothetical protein [Pseudomonas]|jgi:hypothetical protein|uniref:Transmembrane protein n=1 Tax=Pseudomonas putida TaxID=303 RepID=A0A7Y7Z9Y3_PSEPU|nr:MULTISPECIES: hypothetical protein [Pseudomonas]NWC80498.1 hypothetical protein [Pseudomonas putida]
MKSKSSPSTILPPNQLRLLALGFAIALILAAALTIYSFWNHLLPIYGRLYRNAPVVETPFLAFGLLMAPPTIIIGLVAMAVCIWSGAKFDPTPGSRLFNFQNRMFNLSFKTLIYVVPSTILITTLILFLRGYTPCPKLLISGSSWQIFWVNDEHVCFKPDHYINDNWPCKVVDGKEVCVQVDGR